jgi:ankyrin repeat protein
MLVHYGAQTDLIDKHGQTALHKACKMGKLDAILALLDHKCDPDFRDKLGYCPLDYLVNHPNFIEHEALGYVCRL